MAGGRVEPESMRLSELLEDYMTRTQKQIEPSTAITMTYRMSDFIEAVGDIKAEAVTFQHCEGFQAYCFDKGLGASSVNSHLKAVSRIFSLAVKRGQLAENPFKGYSLLKVPQRIVRVLSEDEVQRLLRAAETPLWKARILLAKTAGLRRGEVLNLTWNDIDFAQGKVIVQPKADTTHTWRWVVKDKERRELPLVDEVADLLTELQVALPDGQPYLLLPPDRYRHLMELKAQGKLIDRVAKCPDGNPRRNWLVICSRAGVEGATFQDLRATCITEWFEQGLMPHEVQKLAGHSSIETTMKYYVGYRQGLIDRARDASQAALMPKTVTHLLRAPKNGQNDIKKALSEVM